eukprot:TRINITY_DN1055_c0_g1_i1.p1 TRINITY_DN1055_c0_g1~~TRINITY_DN1055_c0_g1_i1.p1  ORF type:complete len:311 (-),score=62.86 TRINITY_DN1055_c0_g1_i1:34-966(-)
MTAYKDLGKDTRDLLNQNFLPSNTITLTGSYKLENGLTYKDIIKRSPKKDSKTKSVFPFVEVLIEPKYEAYPLEVSAKISTTAEIGGSFVYKDFLTKGCKIDINTTKSDKDGVIAKLDASLKRDTFSGSLVCSYPMPSKKTLPPIKVVGDFVFGYNHTLWGVSAIAEIEAATTNLKTEAAYATVAKDSQLTGKVGYTVKDGSLNWAFGFFHKLSSSLSWALGYENDSSKGPAVLIAFENKLENDSTVKIRSILKNDGTGSTDWRLGLSFKQKTGPYLAYVVSSDLNLRQFIDVTSTTGETHSFGFDLKLE